MWRISFAFSGHLGLAAVTSVAITSARCCTTPHHAFVASDAPLRHRDVRPALQPIERLDVGPDPDRRLLLLLSQAAGEIDRLEQAMLALPVNQVSSPVQTQFGFHLIEVTSRTVEPFDQADVRRIVALCVA